MSGIDNENESFVDGPLRAASFETMASASADEQIARTWPSDDYDEAEEAAAAVALAAGVGEEEFVDEDVGGEELAPVEQVQEVLMRESAKPLKSALKKPTAPSRRADDDDDGEVDWVSRRRTVPRQASGADDDDAEPAHSDDRDEDAGEMSADDSTDADDNMEDLLPPCTRVFSSSEDEDDDEEEAEEAADFEDGDYDDGGDDDDDDDDKFAANYWTGPRDLEPDDGARKAAAVKKSSKKTKKQTAKAGGAESAAVPAESAAPKKRKRAPTDAVGAEKKARRDALVALHRQHTENMTDPAFVAAIRTYCKVAAVDHIMHRRGEATANETFRLMVIRESIDGPPADAKIAEFANAIVGIDAGITKSLAAAKSAEPEIVQLLVDFVTKTTSLTFSPADVPATASRCDLTHRPSAASELTTASVSSASNDGAAHRLIVRKELTHLVQNAWTLCNFYAVVCKDVGTLLDRLAKKHALDGPEQAFDALDADAALITRICKKLCEAHKHFCWHTTNTLKK